MLYHGNLFLTMLRQANAIKDGENMEYWTFYMLNKCNQKTQVTNHRGQH